MGILVIVVFGICAIFYFSKGKKFAAWGSIFIALAGVGMVNSSSGSDSSHESFLSRIGFSYPGYKSPRKALTFAEKHDAVDIAVGTIDDTDDMGPTDGNSVYILKNTKKNGYTFKHDGKYFYLLERITDYDGDTYHYQYDAIPVNYKKKEIPAKYTNVDTSWDGGYGRESLGDSYSTAARFN
ncbi:hypothetical protein FAM21834_01525 [Lentilactobacillus parabuchneri]|jgi:hypothetical protein|uniref:Uncharacterized protein n=3 Tax=Lentilactobacillus parabuchneri TaxID=152331 RepID=A0A1X1FEE9_9LACO|nr:hypothetical protein [Lentilactobacillus parabuchneri]APR07641.1 hypothetical protein FAM21731_01464 [Lentilactobacillus parabuchneri]KRM46050.1 hypothetical protein FC51_GL000629 [Lentilactobacillus parabuchneri DSM 5707 = NBRC 107865]KRN72815.1 hypothetical protein IV42_GL001290 [Lentilactobacillus parabuchneri]MBW0222883.1 hypothetical protein [Lentilactobacillus parabuchneri]MBW0246015.1 hypothetical protein [Lentilactobacillus parabuchneri]